MTGQIQTRAYRKRRRAESEARTRRRITESAVELHGTLGPARTIAVPQRGHGLPARP